MEHHLLMRAAPTALLLAVGLPAGAVETITVVGTRGAGQMYEELHRQTSIDDYCASIGHSQPWCPQYQGDLGPGMPNYGPSNGPCNGTDNVTPHCRCTDSTPKKVYDASTGKFHCRTNPPNAPCAQWDQTFSYDPDVWQCALRPFDADAKSFAKRVKDCGSSTVGRYLNHSLVSVGYGWPSGPDHYGSASCNPKGDNPPTSVSVSLHEASLENVNGASPWHWAALTAIHEFIHAADFIGYDSCSPWLTSGGINDIKAAGYNERDINEAGFEAWTVERANEEYLATFGVRSPYDPRYRASQHNKPLSCLLD